MVHARALSALFLMANRVALVALLLLSGVATVHTAELSAGVGPPISVGWQGSLRGAPGEPATLLSDSGFSQHAPPQSAVGSRAESQLPVRPATIINPLQSYAHEPAPMGIADFGVTASGAGAGAYQYFSPSFEGKATVNSMSVTIAGSSSKVTAFELNAVLVLERGGVNYTYWIQNGLHLDAGSDLFSIGGAYVWNFSSPSARLSSGELTGASGSVLVSDTYYFIPNCAASFPGQCSTLGLPATLTGRIVSSTTGGIPWVTFEYNVGAGWVAYDNVSFVHMTGANDAGFRVDGFVPTPIATTIYYDAEWDWVGAGGGSASIDQGSDIDLSLSYWNGANYQIIPTAWNFGSNTGETSSNISDLRGLAGLGFPVAHLASGPGSLGVLYNQSTVGFLNVGVPNQGAGTVVVDGAPVPFQGNWANLTLLAGPHSLYLQNYTNASAQFDITAGATTFVNLSGAGRVAFTEAGLPNGTTWGVSINATSLSTTAPTLVVNLPNGTYSVSYPSVPGFIRIGSDPALLMVPGVTGIELDFVPFTVNVTFTETGLPDSTLWWVEANGTFVQGNGSTLQVRAPNGSTPYTVGTSYEFVANPPRGMVYISGGHVGFVSVDFSYRPTFIVGWVSPGDAKLSINGVVQTLVAGGFNDSVIGGTYVVAANATGYRGQTADIAATPGNVTWVNFTLVPLPTGVGSNESTSSAGLPDWTVAVVVSVVAGAVIAAGAVLYLRRRRG